MPQHRNASIIGSLLGLLAFAVIAFRPAVAFGRYAGELLAGGIFHGPPSGTLPGLVVGFGIVLGIMAIGSFFLVVGSVLGTLVKAVAIRLFPPTAPAPPSPPAPTRRSEPDQQPAGTKEQRP